MSVELRLTKEERAQLASILGCSVSKLDDVLARVAQAAAEEYVRMFMGQKVFTRGSDVREHRLLLLIRYVFGDRIPDEQQVSALFQTTSSQSRALIRSVMSKYQYELSSAIRETIGGVIGGAEDAGDGEALITTNNEQLIDQMNRQLAALDGTLPQIERKRGTVSSFVVMKSSRLTLRKHFGLDP
jgi:hypothetical protein